MINKKNHFNFTFKVLYVVLLKGHGKLEGNEAVASTTPKWWFWKVPQKMKFKAL